MRGVVIRCFFLIAFYVERNAGDCAQATLYRLSDHKESEAKFGQMKFK